MGKGVFEELTQRRELACTELVYRSPLALFELPPVGKCLAPLEPDLEGRDQQVSIEKFNHIGSFHR